ncbi:choice-of-anchor J domain-containing protein, partial [Flavobacterium aurantiibacter]
MKRIALLIALLFSFAGFAQFTETFEDGFPEGWLRLNAPAGPNFGIGANQQWMLNTTPNPINPSGLAAYSAPNAALIPLEQIQAGNTEEDWMITTQLTVPANGQLRFWTRQAQNGDQGSIFQVRASLNATQNNQTAFQLLQSYTESDLQDLNGNITQYTEKVIDFPAAFIGQSIYIAFVRIHTQPTPTRSGDRWLIDDIRVRQRCTNPNGLDASNPQSTSITLTWNNPGLATSFEIEVVPQGQDPTGTGVIVSAPGTNPTSFNTAGSALTFAPGQCYQYYVRAVCGTAPDTLTSGWAGPFPFCTLPLGSVCADPLVVQTLPYQTAGNTLNFGDEVDTTQGTGCGATPAGTNYLAGNEVFYSYTPDITGNVSILMTPGANNSSLFVYNSCAGIGTSCIAGIANAQGTPRSLVVPMVAGQTYIIVISSSQTTPSIPYTLLIQREDCAPKPTALTATDIGLTTATLGWTSTEFTSWQVAVQPAGTGVPAGNGVAVNTNSFQPTLTAATQYEFWVRAECTPGGTSYTGWAGPLFFNTLICDASNKCDYTFRLTDSANNGWNGAVMQVRQAGIVVASLGPQLGTGSAPANVTVALCDDIPFDIFWVTAGTQPNQCILNVINNFGQTVFTKPDGTGTVGTVITTQPVDCQTPRCDLTPTAVTIPAASVETTFLTVTWSAPATTSWDIIVLPAGSPAPTATSTPTFNDITVADPNNPSFTFPVGTLIPDTAYSVYVRVNCDNPTNSAWGGPATATTDPTCFRPTTPLVTAAAISTPGATTASATFTWTAGEPTNTLWEIYVSPINVAPTAATPATYTNITTTTFTANDLLPATIYYAWVRTVCPGPDPSIWVAFPVFNTDTCFDADRCNYRFLLSTATTGNTWNNARIQVRQNGIVVATLGATGINSAAGVTVALCPNVPFDVFWSVAGTNPDNIGFTVVTPFNDVDFTKLPGQGTPLTVLYTGVTNCNPPACAQPSALTAVPSATSAVLSWTDNSTPPSANFAIYIVPQGGPAPTNNPPTPPTIPSATNPFTISAATGYALQPSTAYTYYVKAICSPTESSAWTILNPHTFITKPINDECATALPVPVNAGQVCAPANNVLGNTFGGTASAPVANTGQGCGTVDDDIWFSFVAGPSGTQTININNVDITPANARIHHSVFSGTCDNLTQLYCSTTYSSNATGLIPGETYYVRAYTSGSAATQRATFEICITSPPANDNCIGATNVPVNPTWTCEPSFNVGGSTLGATASTPPAAAGAGCGTADDDVWFAFTATNPIHVININDIVGSATNVALNHSLFTGPCDALTQIYCTTQTTRVVNGLTVNQVYYIRVYTAANTAGASATFNVCVNTPPPPSGNDTCATAIPVAVNPSSTCNVFSSGNLIGATPTGGNLPGGCVGTADDDVWFSFVATSTTHFVQLFNVEGTTTNLNHAVYTGTCDAQVFRYCSPANNLISTATNLIVGQTYFVRVWSNSNIPEAVEFDICIRSISTCESAEPFCGSSPDQPFIYSNTTAVPSTGQIACLATTPNPTYYTLYVGQDGPLVFNILQNTAFDAAGNPVGNGLDVDFVAWGPFDSPESCNEIVFGPCAPTPCPNNTTDPTFYPEGNIVDCSYSFQFTETLTIPNAQAGEYYIILITNFNGQPGLIRLVQTNFDAADAGETICCDVGLGPDIEACGDSVTLNAIADVQDVNNVPSTFEWFLLPSTTPIPGATTATYVATESGTYKVQGACGLNPVFDEIVVTLGPAINASTPEAYVKCDSESTPGQASFDFDAVKAAVLGALNPADYIITSHNTLENATNDVGDLGLSGTQLLSSGIIYVRVESTLLSTCFAVVPVTFTVTDAPNAAFGYEANTICRVEGEFAQITTLPQQSNGYTAEPTGIVIDPITGAIDLQLSQPGTYTVKNTILATETCEELTATFEVTLVNSVSPEFSYAETAYCKNDTNPLPTVVEAAGTFTGSEGLIINASTGEINLADTPAGTYLVTHTIAETGTCPESTDTFEVTINALPNPTFGYTSNIFCKIANTTAELLVIPDANSNFTASPEGLALNPISGTVDLGLSQPGIYLITNTIPATEVCQEVTATFELTIVPQVSPEFSYSQSVYCKNNSNPLPITVEGTGTYTGTTGLVIDSITGEINLADTPAGTYTVTRTIGATTNCAESSDTFEITINELPDASFAYANTTYCRALGAEAVPLVTPNANSNFTSTPDGLVINPSTGAVNLELSQVGVYTITNTISAAAGCEEVTATFGLTIEGAASAEFNYPQIAYCKNSGNPLPVVSGSAGTFSGSTGLVINSSTGEIDLNATPAGTYTITNTVNNSTVCPVVLDTFEITINPEPSATFSYSSNAYCTTSVNPTPSVAIGLFSATPAGITIDPNTGTIDLAASVPGDYLIRHTIAAFGGCDEVSEEFPITITLGTQADFTYSASEYCGDSASITPIFGFGSVAGSFSSSSTGLSLDPNTGVINIQASSAGTYVVTNQIAAAGGCGPDNASFTITITAPVTGTISYEATAFCKNSTSEQIQNLPSSLGTFSAPSGLTIDSITGEINPSTSNPGTYTVTFLVSGDFGCADFISTVDVTIIPEFEITFESGCENNQYVITVLPVDESFDLETSTIEWSSNGTFTSRSQENEITATSEGTFTAKVTTADGCFTIESINVTNIGCIIQRGISPNN